MNHYDEIVELERMYAFDPDLTSPVPEHVPNQGRTFGWAGVREHRIAEGRCPLPGCFGKLDDSFNCAGCGNTSLPATPPTRIVDLPQPVLPVDEFAPAEVDAA